VIGDEASSDGAESVAATDAAFAFPKLSFQREGFLEGAEGGATAEGVGEVTADCLEEEDEGRRRGVGIAYTGVGSKEKGWRPREVFETVEVLETEDCLLSSRARDWEAVARVLRVSSQ